jgi:methionyl-tRNA formyltransferase
MNLIFAGKGVRAKVCLEYLLKKQLKPILVIGQAGDQHGLIKLAKKHRLSTYIPQNINSKTSFNKINKFKPDLLVLAGFSQILKTPIINLPKKGTINLHGGPLPQYRGASVLNWQIIQGERSGGISIIFVDQGIDTGDIIAEAKFPILPTDTIKEVVNKTLKIFPPMLLKTIKQIDKDKVKRKVQNKQVGKYWKKRRPEDGLMDLTKMTAKQVDNFVRALTKPYPGAFCYLNGKKITIFKTKPLIKQVSGKSGTIISKSSQGLVVKTKDKAIILSEFE